MSGVERFEQPPQPSVVERSVIGQQPVTEGMTGGVLHIGAGTADRTQAVHASIVLPPGERVPVAATRVIPAVIPRQREVQTAVTPVLQPESVAAGVVQERATPKVNVAARERELAQIIAERRAEAQTAATEAVGGYDPDNPKEWTQEWRSILRHDSGYRSARDELVLANVEVVHDLARRYASKYDYPVESDFESAGMTGLLEATEQYEPGRARFRIYAYKAVINALEKATIALQDVHIPWTALDERSELLEVEDALAQEQKRVPTAADAETIAERATKRRQERMVEAGEPAEKAVRVTPERVALLLNDNIFGTPLPLVPEGGLEEGIEFARLPDEPEGRVTVLVDESPRFVGEDEIVDSTDVAAQATQSTYNLFVQKLRTRAEGAPDSARAKVLRGIYDDDQSLRTIAEAMGVTSERVRQIRNEALEAMQLIVETGTTPAEAKAAVQEALRAQILALSQAGHSRQQIARALHIDDVRRVGTILGELRQSGALPSAADQLDERRAVVRAAMASGKKLNMSELARRLHVTLGAIRHDVEIINAEASN